MRVECAVEQINYLSADVRQLLLKPPRSVPPFKAGQYLELILPDRKCAFSIASMPNEPLFQLHIKPTPDSEDSTIIEALLDNPPDSLTVEYPLGECFLDNCPNRPIILIAASTGITQMKSLLGFLQEQKFRKNVFLYWGVLLEDDLYLHHDLLMLAQEWRYFHYIPVVSEITRSSSWQGKTGLVGNTVLADIEDLNTHLIYISGSPAMVYGTLDNFVQKGFDETNMHSDVFSFAPRQLTNCLL